MGEPFDGVASWDAESGNDEEKRDDRQDEGVAETKDEKAAYDVQDYVALAVE